MDNKRRKLIQKDIKAEIDAIDERLMNINEFYKFEREHPDLSNDDFEDICLTRDGRWLKHYDDRYRNREYYINHYLINLKKIVHNDRYYTAGLLKDFADIDKGIFTFAEKTLSLLSNELRYKQIKSIEGDRLLGILALTALKLKTYSICDNLTDEWGDKLARYCTDNKNDIITKLVEEEYKHKSSLNNLNIVEHLSLQELSLLREKIETGEKFFIYRGFAIEEKDKVRRGIKISGDEYYMQDAGTGLSYSLRLNIAYFFAYRSITEGKRTPKWKNNRYYKAKQMWYIPSDKLTETTEKEFSEYRDDKQLKPIVGKYECDPSKITGYHFGVGEGEIIIKPEDLKLLNYDIPHSRTIAEEVIKWLNQNASRPGDLRCSFANGLSAYWGFTPNGDLCYIFAETEKIRDELEEHISYGKEPDEKAYKKLFNVFMENSIEIPNHINPFIFERNGLLDYMKEPKNITRQKGTIYAKKYKD